MARAYYNNIVIKEADCTEVTFAKPPVDYENLGYWSLTAYNMEGYLGTDNAALSAYKAEPNDDGSYTVYLSHQPLGVDNWISTAGYKEAIIFCRWLLAEKMPEQPTVELLEIKCSQCSWIGGKHKLKKHFY